MQHDEVIWQVIRHNHCSFMSKIETGLFCRNPYNATGICNRSSCPLANSRYATIREDKETGILYLYMKTIERAHMPNKLWQRIKLPLNYDKAFEIIDKHMMYWPKYLVHKVKQRLTKMHQMRIRMRRLAIKTREKIMTTPRKEMKRDARRLDKAEIAAAIEKKIEEELLERLNRGVYDDISNVDEKIWKKVLAPPEEELEDDEENEVEYVEGFEDLEEEDDMEDFGLAMNEPLSDDGEDDVDEDDEDSHVSDKKRSRKESKYSTKKTDRDEPVSKSKKKARVLVEVEHEDAGERQTATH
ncbi:protein mak16-like [Chenopodium quinoa]|uniref:protein mak16-like n=1 Tax=Chenopodium quinoa TaxID=63459 RepID=UPI000B78A7DC|nr:protein mak16-like [Chenopodium quinoa]